MFRARSHLPSRTPALALGRSAAAAALAWALACGGGDETARKIERQRAHYSVKLTGWVVAQTPAATPEQPPALPPGEPAPPAAAETTAAEDLTGAEHEGDRGLVAAPPAVSDVHLDFEVRHDNPQKLPGLTVEVTQTDGMGKEKARHRVWLDTAAIEPGATVERTVTLKEVPHAAGDVFTAALRRRIPRGEWSLYKEFPAPR